LLNSLKKLETQFTEGKLSKRQYGREKRVLEDKLSTIMAADRIKKLQGKTVDETPPEYWSEKQKEEEDTEEKEELIKKYVTIPKNTQVETQSSGMSKGKVSLIILLVAAFFIGTGYGVYVMSAPSNNSSGISLTVNDSAFPILNNTTTNTTKFNGTSNKTSTTTATTTNKSNTSTTKKNTSTTTTTSKSTGNSTG
jgi:hypothetical protein